MAAMLVGVQTDDRTPERRDAKMTIAKFTDECTKPCLLVLFAVTYFFAYVLSFGLLREGNAYSWIPRKA